MAVQQNKKSRSKKGMRRSHDRTAVPAVVYCSCGQPALPHRICAACGTYRGRGFVSSEGEKA
jgi:large subunit ribosomal protein L32